MFKGICGIDVYVMISSNVYLFIKQRKMLPSNERISRFQEYITHETYGSLYVKTYLSLYCEHFQIHKGKRNEKLWMKRLQCHDENINVCVAYKGIRWI